MITTSCPIPAHHVLSPHLVFGTDTNESPMYQTADELYQVVDIWCSTSTTAREHSTLCLSTVTKNSAQSCTEWQMISTLRWTRPVPQQAPQHFLAASVVLRDLAGLGYAAIRHTISSPVPLQLLSFWHTTMWGTPYPMPARIVCSSFTAHVILNCGKTEEVVMSQALTQLASY
jgi:hypothetical protein